MGARNLSSLRPQFESQNVRLVGIGVEELGVEEFIKGQYFTGDLFIDSNKQCYKDLGFRRLNLLTVLPVIFSKVTRQELNKAKEAKIEGNMLSGDGFQNGGLIIVQAGGKLLYYYKQEDPNIYCDNSEILKALGMKTEVSAGPSEATTSS